MFFHSFKYALIELFRNKSQLFWCLAFPIILGTFFYFAFGNLDSDEAFDAIPVAVVLDDSERAAEFQSIIDTMSEPGEDQFLEATYTTNENALHLLEQKEVDGILYGGDEISLTISSEMPSAKLQQSILNSFVQTFQMHYNAIYDIAKEHPENMSAVVDLFSKDVSYNRETSYSDGTLDQAVTYFFNLIAMTCLYACMAGNAIAIENQANLSDLGARKNISPVHKFISLLGGLAANVLVQAACVTICLFYLQFILKVNFGNQFGYSMLGIFAGCLTGVSLGFFIGSIGHMSRYAKDGILMGGTMFCCFLSGLMMGNIRIYLEKYAPFVNKINPAARISDCFYSLTIYSSYDRYWQNIFSLLILSAILFVGGFILVRRNKYASL